MAENIEALVLERERLLRLCSDLRLSLDRARWWWIDCIINRGKASNGACGADFKAFWLKVDRLTTELDEAECRIDVINNSLQQLVDQCV